MNSDLEIYPDNMTDEISPGAWRMRARSLDMRRLDPVLNPPWPKGRITDNREMATDPTLEQDHPEDDRREDAELSEVCQEHRLQEHRVQGNKAHHRKPNGGNQN